MLWEYVEKIETWLSDYPEYVILITGGYIAIYAAIFVQFLTDSLKFWLAIVGIGLMVVSGISLWLSHKGKKRIKDYERENNELKNQVKELTYEDEYHQDTILEIVKFLNKYIGDCVLEFCDQPHYTDRISLYVFDEEGFFPIARYSANPLYNSLRRHLYPPEQGAICHAWTDGEYFRIYPDPVMQTDDYYRVLENQEHIPRSEAEKFSMKPILIYGYRIGENHQPKAVFIVESVKKSRFTKVGLDGFFRNSEQIKICIEIILRLELPNPYIGENWETEN